MLVATGSFQAEVLRVQREHVSKGLNQYLSMLIIDCHHWAADGDWSFNRTAWPDPKAVTAELKAHSTAAARCHALGS